MGHDRAAAEAAALRFACVARDRLPEVRRRGLAAAEAGHAALEAALRDRQPGEAVLVLAGVAAGDDVAPEVIANLSPYREPKPVEAGGGLVVRAASAGPEVLLIFRRGAWDLPKGKQDDGETLAECALREVREEVGVRHLELLAPAGETVHGYPEGDRYTVKHTAWYLMRTPETAFHPEEREGIERVEWVPWHEACARLGYETLRQLLDRVKPQDALNALDA